VGEKNFIRRNRCREIDGENPKKAREVQKTIKELGGRRGRKEKHNIAKDGRERRSKRGEKTAEPTPGMQMMCRKSGTVTAGPARKGKKGV